MNLTGTKSDGRWCPGPNADLIGVRGSRGLLQTPALILDLPAMERNIACMAKHSRTYGVGLRPHAKTHKSVEIARMQMAAGALGICTATLGEAEVMVDGGIHDVLITTPTIVPLKITRLMGLTQKAPELKIVVDSLGNAAALAEAAQSAGVRLQVAVALDAGLHRVGAVTVEDAAALARRISETGSLSFAGIHAYAGTIQHVKDYAERARLAEQLHERIRKLVVLLQDMGLPPPFVSGAGTGTYEIDARAGAFTDMQAGSYVFCDVEYDVVKLTAAEAQPFEPALFVRTTVVSANHPGIVTTDGGNKHFAGSVPPAVSRGTSKEALYGFMSDEHGRLTFPDGVATLAAGASLEMQPAHCDPTVNLHNAYHVVRDDVLLDIWPISARGAI